MTIETVHDLRRVDPNPKLLVWLLPAAAPVA
jgi:hypothetical protein